MKTYLTLIAVLLCTSFHCLSQGKPDYAAAKEWVEERVGGTNRTPEAERIFVVSHSPEYAAIIQYRKGITLREIIDQTKLRDATLIVAVERSIESEGKVFQNVTPSDSPAFEVKRGDIIWLVDISPPLWVAKLPNTTLEPTPTAP